MPDGSMGYDLFYVPTNDDGTIGEPVEVGKPVELSVEVEDPRLVLPDFDGVCTEMVFGLPWYLHGVFVGNQTHSVRSLKKHGKSHKGKECRCR